MSLRPPPSRAVFSAPTRRPLRIAAGALGYGPIEVDSGPVPPPTAAPPVPVGDPPHPKTRKSSDDAAVAQVSGLVADEELFARPAAEAEFFGPPELQDDWNDWDDKTDQDLDQGQGPGDERFGEQDAPAARGPHRWPGRPTPAWPIRSRDQFTAGVRLLIGLDRKRSRGPVKGKANEDPAWLAGPEPDDGGPTTTTTTKATRQRRQLRGDAPDVSRPDAAATEPATPVRAALLRRSLINPDADLQVVKAPREWSSTLRRVAVITVLGLFMVAGIKQVLWNPIFGTKTATTAVAGLDPAAADAAATRYALDYFSYSPAAAAAGQSALAADVVGGGATAAGWTGTGYLRADSALPGAMFLVDPAHAVIDVTVRISLGMPPAPKPGGAPAAAPASTAAVPAASAASAADPGALPPGWTDLGSRWVTVAVPIDASSGAPKVAASGPILTGETSGQVTAAGSVGDTTTGAATQGVASAFFAAYADSDVAYLAAPGVNLAGLSGAVSLVSLTNWTAAVPAAATTPPTSAVGTGTVTWQLAGTDLQIKQQYAMALTNSQNRWYAAALSPLSPVFAP